MSYSSCHRRGTWPCPRIPQLKVAAPLAHASCTLHTPSCSSCLLFTELFGLSAPSLLPQLPYANPGTSCQYQPQVSISCFSFYHRLSLLPPDSLLTSCQCAVRNSYIQQLIKGRNLRHLPKEDIQMNT